MAAMKHKNLKPAEAHLGFKEMGRTYKEALDNGNFLGAYVIAFSYLEDRVTAMDVVRGDVQGMKPEGFMPFSARVERLRYADDLALELAKTLLAEAKSRNDLVHGAMWNIANISAVDASRAMSLGRHVENARKAQKRRLGR